MTKEFAPIIVFAYNRPDHLRRTLEALSLNAEAAGSLLFIYCDGPKKNADAEQLKKIDEVRKVARERNWCKEVIVREAGDNLGLAGSVIKGVTEVVNEYGSVIVLEDDHVTSPWFLKYMNEALTLYADSEEVISISGYVYPLKDKSPETFFLRGADCWGWATWQRGWELFERNGKKLLDQIEADKCGRDFDFNGTYPYTQMLRDQVEGKISSWAILWYASAFVKNKLTLYPGKSFVQNIGVDGSGTHSGNNDTWKVILASAPSELNKIAIAEDKYMRGVFSDFFNQLRGVSWGKRILNKFSRLFS